MEHLPLPHGALITVEERASYIAESYDGGSFEDYPNRSRFAELYSIFVKDGQIKLYPLPSGKAHLLADLEVFLQTWLFFGLIHEMFGNLASPDMFIDRDSEPSRLLLTTAGLPQIVKAWGALKDRGLQADMDTCAHLN
nr:hypothetical protein B0A51_08060 [Rachicladosporium sp. CCFEE 5018]